MSVRLGIDAAETVASCALSVDGKIKAAGSAEKPLENLPELIRKVTAEGGVTIKDIDEVAVCVGPGSQMGVRTSVVMANALALALEKPVSAVLSTDAAAAVYDKDGDFSVAVSAGRRRWFTQSFTRTGGIVTRRGDITVSEDIPAGAFAPFIVENGNYDSVNCAVGVLRVLEEQKQLIAQDKTDEVQPFEFE